ncbi:MAG: HEAT repeat domain-containing protein, partial [Rivularia sp. (in: cyanobacteria)]
MTDSKDDIQNIAQELLIQLPTLSNRELRQKYLSQQQYIDILMVTIELLEDVDRAIHIINLASNKNQRLAARLAGAAHPQIQQETVRRFKELVDKYIAEKNFGIDFKIGLLRETASGWVIPDLSYLLLESKYNHYHSAQALKTFASQKHLGNTAILAEDVLLEGLKHSNPNVRETSAGALGDIGSNRAIPLLIDNLREDADWRVRSTAAAALGSIGNQEALEPLLAALKDSYGNVRGCAARALILLGNNRAIEPL